MGSIVMEPGDITAFKNFSSICTYAHRIHATSVFAGGNPLEFSVPLLLLQLAICAGTISLFSLLLKPLGQPLIVSQILGGLVLGSSGLGHLEKFGEAIFPDRGLIFLDGFSALGHIFYFFLIGVQMDISIVKNIDRRAFAIGVCSVIFPFILTNIYPVTLINIVDIKTVKSLLEIGKAETIINFTMVASLLFELHLINSNFGRIALSSSMVSNVLSFFLVKLVGILDPESEARYKTLMAVYGIVVVAIFIFAIRPAILWMIKQNPVGQPLKEGFVVALLLGVLVVAFCSQASGMHIYIGPLLLGIAIPAGPPIGSTLVERLEFITSWIFMPIFFLKIGLIVNIHTIKLVNLLGISFIIFVCALGKFFGALMMSMHYKLPMRDSISLALILNSQGVLELGMFKLMKKDKKIDGDVFAVMCIYVMVLVALITPIIRYLFGPSIRYAVHKKRTVMHSRPEIDLCVLVSIHDQEDVPSAINLLEALNPI